MGPNKYLFTFFIPYLALVLHLRLILIDLGLKSETAKTILLYQGWRQDLPDGGSPTDGLYNRIKGIFQRIRKRFFVKCSPTDVNFFSDGG